MSVISPRSFPRTAPRWPKYQRGMGKWGWLFVTAFSIMAFTTALKVGPHYIDFEIVKSTLERLPADVHSNKMSRDSIREHFDKQFRIETITFKARDIVEIERDRERTSISVNYEVREPLFYNADVVLVFSEQRVFE